MEMWLWGKRPSEKRSFLDILRKIKSGDKLLKDRFLSDYKPFIIKSVSQILNRYIDIENSEEYSIGLIAFNEAIDRYDEERNCSFKKFSFQVIKRRLIDYMRKSQKDVKVYPFSYFDGYETGDFEEKYLKTQYHDHARDYEIREEFSTFISVLDDFGISMEELINTMPKHIDSRKTCIKIAKCIAEDNDLYDNLFRKKTIPFKKLMEYIEVSQRTVERNRKYIITLVLVLRSDLDILKSYIKRME